MGNQYRLVGMGNSELLAGLSKLVQQSNAITGQLLTHLVELEERKLHLELGFSSLFAYCVEALGMSEGTAGRRVTAARVCRRFPEVFERIARGELHLCALCALGPHLNPENAADLFTVCKGKTRRQVEELLAVRFPRPDVREQIRRLPARPAAAAAPPVAPNLRPTRPNDEPVSQPILTAPLRARTPAPDSRPRAREVEPLSAERFGVHFTADAELRDLIERARALASHRLPNGDLASLMKLMVASFVRHEEKRRFGIGARSRLTKEETKAATPPGGAQPETTTVMTRKARVVEGATRGRYVSVMVRREAHAREGGRCAFESIDGRRCQARAFLEFDHLKPFAQGGASARPNIRLLCKAHNLLHARNCFGAMHIAAKIAASKHANPRRATPRAGVSAMDCADEKDCE